MTHGSSPEEHVSSLHKIQLSNWKHKRSYPLQNIITPLDSGIQIRSKTRKSLSFSAFLSQIEPKNIKEALKDTDWIIAMQEKLRQFERNSVWNLVPLPTDITVIGTRSMLMTSSLEQQLALYVKNKLMGSELEMSMTGELNFILDFQVKQTPKGTMIRQQKYIKKLLKRFGMETSKIINTPIAIATLLDMDKPGSLSKQATNALHIGQRMRLTFAKSVREPGSLDIVTFITVHIKESKIPLFFFKPKKTFFNPLHSTMYENHLQEQEAKENMLSIAIEGTLVGGYEYTGEPIEGLDPSAQEEPSTSTWDKTPSSPQETQVKTDPAPSPYFYVEPLTIVVPEMRSLFEEEKEDSEEEDYDNVALASFISARSKKEKKKRRLVKDGKVVNEKVVVPALVVNVDDEVEEELGPLVRKSSKKLTVRKSKRESSVREKELRNVEDEKSGEKEDEKMVEESCEKVTEESAEKISRKSAEKGKSVRKSMKRKADASDEPGSSSFQSTEVTHLTRENADIRKQVEDLKKRLLNEQVSVNA
ncbi:uncharacterized protein [Nicotiana sylvestris]|uniref:uncharacterized protein n=1 Tax=Nicotiana sylvestris TaxID=4096 RepID=UPI00388CE6D6